MVVKYRISPYQFGFRKKAQQYLLAYFNLIKTTIKNLEEKSYVCGIFLDMSRVFDHMDFSRLLSKMERFRVRGVANKWFKSDLVDRTQLVQIRKINKVNNDTYIIEYYNSEYLNLF